MIKQIPITHNISELIPQTATYLKSRKDIIFAYFIRCKRFFVRYESESGRRADLHTERSSRNVHGGTMHLSGRDPENLKKVSAECPELPSIIDGTERKRQRPGN